MKTGIPGLAKKKVRVDLKQLFDNGNSNGICFGKTTPSELEKILNDEDVHSTPGNEFSTWFVYSDDLEFYFDSKNPRLYGCKINLNYIAPVWGGSRGVVDEMSPPSAGRTVWNFSKLDWKNLEILPEAIRSIERNSYKIGSGPEKQIFLIWEARGREMSFEYLLGPQPRENNLYEFDYFLHAVRLNDNGKRKKLIEQMTTPRKGRARK